MKKAISLREEILLGVLLIVAAYYLMVQGPISSQTKQLEAESQTIQSQIDVLKPKVAQKKAWQKELDEIYEAANGDPQGIPDYDNVSNINYGFARLFDDKGASRYSLTMSPETNYVENIKCREIRLTFTTSSYDVALQKIRAIRDSENRYLIGNVTISNASGSCSVSMNLTSFEYVSN